MPVVHVSVSVLVGPFCSSGSSATSPRGGRTASGATPHGGCPAPPKESIDGGNRRVGARAGRTLRLVLVVFDEPPTGADGTRSESTLWTPGTSEGVSSELGFSYTKTRETPPGLSLQLASRLPQGNGRTHRAKLPDPGYAAGTFTLFPPAGSTAGKSPNLPGTHGSAALEDSPIWRWLAESRIFAPAEILSFQR